MNFVMLRQKNEESDRAHIYQLKQMASAAGPISGCCIHGYAVIRVTHEGAEAALESYVVQFDDDEAVNNMLSIFCNAV